MSTHFDLCILGLGPVGVVSGACFAKQGFKVVGVDSDAERVKYCAQGKAHFAEPAMDELLASVMAKGLFTATTDAKAAIASSRIVMIAVGTPASEDGSPDLRALDSAAKIIGGGLAGKKKADIIVVVRSTVLPGTTRKRLTSLIAAASGLEPHSDFHLCVNPEFLRRGRAIDDFFHPSRIVIGADDDRIAAAVEELYKDVTGKRIRTSIETAEFAKYADNSWHALKVAFANEMGRMAANFGGSPQETAGIFLADDKLNISARYLTPGAPFGGACLPKDIQALSFFARQRGVSLPVIDSIHASNSEQLRHSIKTILATGAKTVGLLGVAFKPYVDNIQESPSLAIADALQKKGVTVIAHDVAYQAGSRVQLPGGEWLSLSLLEQVEAQAECFVLLHAIDVYKGICADAGRKVINLAKAS